MQTINSHQFLNYFQNSSLILTTVLFQPIHIVVQLKYENKGFSEFNYPVFMTVILKTPRLQGVLVR